MAGGFPPARSIGGKVMRNIIDEYSKLIKISDLFFMIDLLRSRL